MKFIKNMFMIVILIVNITLFSGCWNYREIDKLNIVSGVAVDKSPDDDKYLISVEIVDIKPGGREANIEPKIVESTGDTIFDAVRNIIKTTGKRLYWSHAKIVIIGKDVARDGIVQILDFFNRDSEIRIDMDILISKEKNAKDILNETVENKQITSFEVYNTLSAQKSLSKAPKIELYKFVSSIQERGQSAILPSISLVKNDGKKTHEVFGTSVFKKDRLVGFLNEEDTKYLLFIKNSIKGGLLIQEEGTKDSHTNIALEIFKSSTKIKPVYADEKITMNIDIKTEVAIAEEGGLKNFIDEEGRSKIKRDMEESMSLNIKRVIKEVQEEYDSDIFGFGLIIKQDMPDLWKSIEAEWEERFKQLDVNVNTSIDITNSAIISKPIKVGD